MSLLFRLMSTAATMISSETPWWMGVPTKLIRKTTLVPAAVNHLPVHTLTFAIPKDATFTGRAISHSDVRYILGLQCRCTSCYRLSELLLFPTGSHCLFPAICSLQSYISLSMQNHPSPPISKFRIKKVKIELGDVVKMVIPQYKVYNLLKRHILRVSDRVLYHL